MSVNHNVVLNLAAAVQGTYYWINWIRGGINYGGNSTNINVNGCPVTAPPHSEIVGNAWRMSVQVPASQNYSGHWVLKWSGTGAFSIDTQDAAITVDSGAGFVVSNAGTKMLVAGANVRVEFHTATTAGAWFGQMNDTQTYSGMGAPRLIRVADETAESNGEFFLPDFITQIKQLNPQVLRFMQWQQIPSFNNCMSKPFTYDSPTGYISVSSQYQALNPFAGTITNTADVLTCSAAPDTPGSITDGETIYGVVSSSNTTTTPTLNIAGRGAKTILGPDGAAIPIGGIAAGTSSSFSYNATLNGYIHAFDSSGSFFAFPPRVPLSIIVALGNKTNCDIWICIPPFAIDSEVTAMANYVTANLNTNLNCYWEVGNEIWGGVPHPGDFVQTLASLPSFGNGTGRAQVLGYFTRRFMGLITTAWSPRSLSSLKRVAAWQEFGDPPGFNSACLQGQGFTLMTTLGWDTAPNRPVDFTDVISYATYYEGPSCPAFQGGYTGNVSGVQAALYTAADNYASGIPANITSALNFMDNDIRKGTGGNGDTSTLAGLLTQNQIWETMLATYDASRTNKLTLECYEGGLQINPPTSSTLTSLGVNTAYVAKIANLFNGYKNDNRFRQLVLDQYAQFMLYAHSVRPSWYQYGADIGGAELQWDLFPTGDIYGTPFQSYNSIQQWDNSAPLVPSVTTNYMLLLALTSQKLLLNITDTNHIQLPINAVLIDDQDYQQGHTEIETNDPNIRTHASALFGSSIEKIGSYKPSIRVTKLPN